MCVVWESVSLCVGVGGSVCMFDRPPVRLFACFLVQLLACVCDWPCLCLCNCVCVFVCLCVCVIA